MTSASIRAVAVIVLVVVFVRSGRAETARVALRVRVKTPLGLPAAAYVAVVGMDRPMSRPTYEKIAPSGVAEFQLLPGDYRLMVGAVGYPDQTLPLSVQAARELPITLPAASTLSGVVTDAGGAPVTNARVMDLRAASPPGVAPTGKFAVGKPSSTVLSKGGALHAQFDRIDRDAFVTLHRVDVAPADAGWQHRVFSRNIRAKEVDWTGLAPGKYQVLATYLDPRYFTTPYVIGSVDVRLSETSAIDLKLPRAALVQNVRKLFVADMSSSDLVVADPIITTAHGADQPRHSLEQTVGGVVTYLDTASPIDSIILVTPDRVIVPDEAHASALSEDVIPTNVSDRADASLILKTPKTDNHLPLWGTATFDGCEPVAQTSLALPISREGRVDIPYPVACGGFVLAVPPFEAIVMRATLQKREKRAFGDVGLRMGARVEAFVKTDSGIPVPKATVRAMEGAQSRGRSISYATATADDEGHVVLSGIPPMSEIMLEAVAPNAAGSGAAIVRMEPGKTIVVDPLEVRPAGRMVVTAKLAEGFRRRFPKARIDKLAIVADDPRLPNRRIDAPLINGEKSEFNDVAAGRWKPIALVSSGTDLQPIPLEAVEVKPGRLLDVTAQIDPPVFEGVVMSAGQGVAATIGFAEPASAGSVIRFATSRPDGRFTALLAMTGIYAVQVTRRDTPDETVDLGEVDMTKAQLPIHLALPGGSVAVRVLSAGEPVAGAQVGAALRTPRSAGGFTEVRRNGESDAAGKVIFHALLPGEWTIEARDEKTGQAAQGVVRVAGDEAAPVVLELAPPAAVAGFVHTASDAPVDRARVDCIYSNAAGAQLRTALSDANGHFKMDLPSEAPQTVHCGVTARSGDIGAFVLSPTTSADLRLGIEAGSLTISDWGRRLRWNEYWLVAADGRMFSLTWAAGQMWRPLTIRGVPAGFWKIVRAADAESLRRLASAGGNALPTTAQFQISDQKSVTIELDAGR